MANSASGVIQYTEAGHSTGVQFISSQTASAASSVEFTSGIDDTYGEYILVYNITEMSDTAATRDLHLTVSDDGGTSYKSTSYNSDISIYTSSTTDEFTWTNSTSAFEINRVDKQASNNPQAVGYARIYGLTDSTRRPVVYSYGVSNIGSGPILVHCRGQYTATIDVNALKLALDTGTFTGKFTLYGSVI